MRYSAWCFGKQCFAYLRTNGSVEVIADEHDHPGMCISINQNESPQGGIITVLKGKKNNRRTNRNPHCLKQ